MSNTTPAKWQKCEEGAYWNNQGIAYAEGRIKPFSLSDARRCFEKAIQFNDIDATYNLFLLIEAKLVTDSIFKKEDLRKTLVDVGYISKSELNPPDSISDNGKKGKIDLAHIRNTQIAVEYRLRAEALINDFSPKKQDGETFVSRTNRAIEQKYLSRNEGKTIIEIWKVCSEYLHAGGTTQDYSQMLKTWDRVLDRLENRP